MNKENLYITYAPDEIKIFLSLAPHSNQTYTATSQLLKAAERISIFKDIPEFVLIKIVKNVKIIRYHNGEIVIKCGNGAVRIIEHEFVELPKKGEYL